MSQRLHVSGKGSVRVPSGAVLIDPRIVNIKAVKGSQSHWPGEWFIHRFKRGGKMYHVPGFKIPQGAELIYSRVQSIKGSRKNYRFENPANAKIYGLLNGNVLVTDGAQRLLVVANHALWDKFNYPD